MSLCSKVYVELKLYTQLYSYENVDFCGHKFYRVIYFG